MVVSAPAPGEFVSGTFTGALDVALDTWVDYSSSFAVTAAVTNPTKGNSIYVAKYVLIGQTVHFTFKVTIGSTWGIGSGAYNFGVPFPAKADRVAVGSAWLNDSGTAIRSGVATFDASATALRVFPYNLTAAPLDSAGPGTAWATNDAIMVSITYEQA